MALTTCWIASALVLLVVADSMRSDQTGSESGLMTYGFAWAAGILNSNHDLISELHAAGGLSDCDQVQSGAEGRLKGANRSELEPPSATSS